MGMFVVLLLFATFTFCISSFVSFRINRSLASVGVHALASSMAEGTTMLGSAMRYVVEIPVRGPM